MSQGICLGISYTCMISDPQNLGARVLSDACMINLKLYGFVF